MAWVNMALYILVITIIAIFLFSLVRTYILTKYKIKKIYPLLIMIALLFLPLLLPKSFYQSFIVQAIQMLLVSLSFLTYFELMKMDKEARNKPVVGRPKKKPNRLKDTDEK